MTGLEIFYSVLGLIAGVGVFLFGLKLMGDGLENLAGNKIKKLFSKLDKNILVSTGIGISTTAIIQSSSAVTVMAVGFVNSGFMSLFQATGVIFGANIGTTITAQIMALGFGGIRNFNATVILATFAGIGAFMTMSKKDIIKKIGSLIAGFGMIFVGLSLMGINTSKFAESNEIMNVFQKIKNPVLLLLAGAVFTAVLQSSSAFSGIIITMSAVDILTFYQAMFLIVGSNIGTCVTAGIACIGSSTNAKRVAVIHLLFNVIGSILFCLINLGARFELIIPKLFPSTQVQIAMLHTLFNLGTVLILLPFARLLVKFVVKIVPESKRKTYDEGKHFYFVDDNLLRTPVMAIAQLKREIMNMYDFAMSNFYLSMQAISTNDYKSLNGKIDEFYRTEEIINFLNRELTKYMVKINLSEVPLRDRVYISTAYHTISDIERIGDHSVNIMEDAKKSHENDVSFSADSKKEVLEMVNEIKTLSNVCKEIYITEKTTQIPYLYIHEQVIDDLKDKMSKNHVVRLSEGSCTPEAGAIYLNLATNCERVGDHLTNIANSVKSFSKTTK